MREPYVILSGVVGSVAYGLNTPESDVDRLGVFLAPTREALSVSGVSTQSIVTTSPDVTMHEAAKFASLALKCNPTVMELLWLDTATHAQWEIRVPFGDELIDMRESFLSSNAVRNAYLGYAVSQFRKCQQWNGRRYKHARHMARLVMQGLELLATGRLSLAVADPEWFHDFSAAGPDVWEAWFKRESARFDQVQSVLPGAPDVDLVNDWLYRVRMSRANCVPTGPTNGRGS